jgi:hypothetical protein
MNRAPLNPMSAGESNRPSFVVGSLFLLLFSGPPRFRERDPVASLRGDIDTMVILHVLVWAVAGIWVFYQMRFYFQENLKPVGFRLPQWLGLGLVVALGMSTFVSVSPPLTAFMVYETFISLMFITLFVERYGMECCLRKLFQASSILCMAIVVAYFAFPDLVIVTTETGAPRLRGDYIAPTEVVALLTLVLLIAGVQKLSKPAYIFLLGLSSILIVISLSRTVYVILFVMALMALVKRGSPRPVRLFAYLFGIAFVLLVILGFIANMNEYRDPASIVTMSDRLGLWTYLSNVTLDKSPFFGLGYYAASRVYGPQYNPDLGAAHSMFVETFAGGGLFAITILLALCVVVSIYVTRAFRQGAQFSFELTVLFLATMMFGFIGGSLDSGPIAITFWSLAAIVPTLQNRESRVSRGALVSYPSL